MRGNLRPLWPATIAAIMIFGFCEPFWAQEKNSDDRTVYDALGKVIDHGARLYNDAGDYAGCYRVYEAALLTIKPFLADRPKLQKAIEDGLEKARTQTRVIDRAFTLRYVLRDIRAGIVPSAVATAEKKSQKKPKNEARKATAFGSLSGKVLYDGRPARGIYLTLIAQAGKPTFSTYINAEGGYFFRTPIPVGRYTVVLEPGRRVSEKLPALKINVPARYRSAATSGIVLEVVAAEMVHDIDLQKD